MCIPPLPSSSLSDRMVLNMAVVITEGLAAKHDVKCTGGLLFLLTLCQVRKEEY